MLVTVTCLFIILRFPEMIFVQISLVHPEIYIKVASWSKLVMLLTIVNHSVNFFVYLIFLESFRKEISHNVSDLVLLLWKKTGKRNCGTTRRADDLGVQKSKTLSCPIIEARGNAVQVFTIETDVV